MAKLLVVSLFYGKNSIFCFVESRKTLLGGMQTSEKNQDELSDDGEDFSSDDEMDETPPLCTFAATGTNSAFQSIFVCLECTDAEGSCICHACAKVCHAGHDVDYIAMGPAYCDCQQACCRLKDDSETEAVRIGVPLRGLKEHVAPPSPEEGNYIQEAFTISSLDDQSCDRLVKEATELIKYSRDTQWIELNSEPDEKYSKLEELALVILRRHTMEYNLCDDAGDFQGGAEWWVQVKPVTVPMGSSESQLDHLTEGDEAVDLHYDKDEVLAESFDLGSFPTLSTVTYLTSTPNGSPTVIFPHTYDKDEGEVIPSMLVSYPRRRKHLVFDGRLLHGAPAHHALRRMDGEDTECTPENLNRVTFLVNIWIGRQPSGVKQLSSTIRQRVRTAGKKRNKLPSIRHQREKGAAEFETKRIEDVDLEKEDELTETIRGRIELPFVSKGATWISRVKGNDLVVVTFPPPPSEEDTINVRFGPGLQAYLEYQSHDNGNVEERVNMDSGDQVDYV